jgi:cold-inducible RNA-binding protein
MLNRLFVGNLAFHVTEDLLKQRVSECGEVQSVDLILDRMTGRPRGFAFVEMSSSEGMQKALADLDGKDFEGRTLNVKVAEERRTGGGAGGGPRGGGGGGGPRGGGGGGGGGGNRGGRDGGSGWGRGR